MKNQNEISNGAILTTGQILKVTTEKMDSGLTGVDHVGATEVRFIEVAERSKWGVTLKVHVPEGGGRRGAWKFSERFFEISPITVQTQIKMKNKNQKNTSLAVLAALLLAAPAEAVEINGKLLDAVAHVESNGNHRAVGDQGKANGAFQLHRPAWVDAGKWLKANGFKTTTYTKGVNDPSVSRIYARTYLSLIHGQLATRMEREPTAGELYAAYNMGVGGFAKRGFDVRRTPATTRRAIAKLYKAIENPTTKGTK